MVYEMTQQQLQDYMSCPIYYSFKYAKSTLYIDQAPTFSKLLNRIISGFCLQLMDGKVMRLDFIKRKWDMLCKQNVEVVPPNKIREGMARLYKFFLWAQKEELRIADVGSEYIIKFDIGGNNQIHLHGSLGIIAVTKNDLPQSLRFSYQNALPDEAALDSRMDITLDHIGFRSIYHQRLAGTKIHHIRSGRDYFTTRDIEDEYPRIKEIVTNVNKAIRFKLWYPHESPFCQKCKVKNFCQNFGKKSI